MKVKKGIKPKQTRCKKNMSSLVLTSDGGGGTSKLCDVTDDREDVELVSSERDWKLGITC